MRDILRKSYDRMIKDGLCQPLAVKGSTMTHKSNRTPKFYLKNKAPFSSRKPVLRKFSIEQVATVAPDKLKCPLGNPAEEVQNSEQVKLETQPSEKVKNESKIKVKRKNKIEVPTPNRTNVKPTKTAARRILEKAKRGCTRGRRKQKGEIGRNVKKKLRKKYQISPKKRKFAVVKNPKSSPKSNCRQQKIVNDVLSKTKNNACPGVMTRGHSNALKSNMSQILNSSSDCRQSASVQNNNRSPHRSVTPQKRSLSVGRKKFVLPPVSARSSRRIIPRKRYLDDAESSSSKNKQIKDDDSESSKSARSCVSGNILGAESGCDLHDEKYASGSRRKIGLLDQPLVVEGKRPWKPSLKVQMKLSEMSYDSPFGLRKSDDRSSGTGTSSGSFKDIIKPDMVSKYADIMAKRGKEKTAKSVDGVKKSTPESSKAASETSKSGFVESIENDIRKSEERLEKVAAKIERLLKSQWEGRLKRADDSFSQSLKTDSFTNREKDVESPMSRWKNEDQQRASNQKRTKSIIRKAKLQLKKRTLMRLRRTLDVKVVSDLPPHEVSQSTQDKSRSMSTCAVAEETPVPSKLNQCASPAQPSQQGVVTCCVCGVSKNQIAIQKRYRQLTCQLCISFFGNFTRNPQQFFCSYSGNCSLQCSVASEKFCSVVPVIDSRCKACWLKTCLEKLTVSSLLRERLMTFVPRLENSQDPLIKDKTAEQQGSFAFADLVQTAETIKNETTASEGINSVFRDNPSDSRETCGSDKIKTGFPTKPSCSTTAESHSSRTYISENHATSSTVGEISAHISENKTSENQIVPIVDEIKVHGPRIKHVCRRAAVVLGLPRATFPAPSNEASFNLSALPQEEKQKILETESVPQDKSTCGDKQLQKNCDKKNSKGSESETKVKNTGDSLKKQLPLHKRQKKKKLIKKSFKHLHKHSFKKPLKLGHKTLLKKPNKFSYKSTLNKAPIKSALKLPLKRPVRPARFRKVRCKECEGCLAEDCGECVYCLDKKKFGGPNLIKQACMFRRCLRPVMPTTEKKAAKPQSEGGGDGKPSGGHSSFGGGGPSGIGTSLSTSSSSSPSSSPDGSSCGSSCSSSSSSSSSSGSSSSSSSNSSSSSSSNSSSSSKSGSSSSNSGKRSNLGVFSASLGNHSFKQLSAPQDFTTEPVPLESVAFSEEIETGLFCDSPSPYSMDYKLPVFETCSNSQCSSDRSSAKNSPARQKAVPVRKPAPPVDKEKRGFNGKSIDLQSQVEWKSDDTYHVNASYWEDNNMEKIYNQGFTLISSQYIPLRTPCFLCGSAGLEDVIFCVVCCEPFHTFCLSKTDVPLKENIDNWCCYRCQSCAVCGQKSGHKYNTKGHHSQKLLKCKKCQNSYHADCLGPNYPSKPSRKKRIWVCPKCVRCKSCGTTTPTAGTGLLWNFDLLLCQSCTKLTEKGNFCPICHRCYEEDDYESQMVQCYKCDRWVHAKCDNISDEMYEILSCLPENIVYTCINCTTENPPFWRVAINNALKNGLKTIISALLNARCTRHLISRKDNGTSANHASGEKVSNNSTTVKNENNPQQDHLLCESNHNGCAFTNHESTNLDCKPRNMDLSSEPPKVLNSHYEHKVISTGSSAVGNLENQEIRSEHLSVTDFSAVSVGAFRSVNSISNLEKTSHETVEIGKLCNTECSELISEQGQNTDSGQSLEIQKISSDSTECENSNHNVLCNSMGVVNLNCSPSTYLKTSVSGHASSSDEVCSSHVHSDKMTISRNLTDSPVNFKSSLHNQTSSARGFMEKGKLFAKKEQSLHNSLDLTSVKKKIESGKYRSVESFFDEIIQIFEGGYSDVKKIYAQAARSMFAKQLEKVFPWFKLSHHKLWNGEKNPSPRNGVLSDAFVPPSADHTYAQYMIRNPPAPVVQPHKYRNLSGGDFCDPRRCVLCSKNGDLSPFESGRMLYCGQDDWIHVNCAVWSAEVIQMHDGLLQNVYPAISRGKLLRCERCKQFGATVGCCVRGCPANYHFNCARKEDAVFQVDKTVFCSLHVDNIEEELVEDEDFIVDECVFVGQNEIKPKWIKKSWQDGTDLRHLHVVIGSLTVESFGYLTQSSDSSATLIPVNFKCTRIFWSTKNPHQRVTYRCRTVEVLPEVTDAHLSCENLTIAHDTDEINLSESLTEGNTMSLSPKSFESDVTLTRKTLKSDSRIYVMDNNLKASSLCSSITPSSMSSMEFSGGVQQVMELKPAESSAEFPLGSTTQNSVEMNDLKLVSQTCDSLSNSALLKVPEKETYSKESEMLEHNHSCITKADSLITQSSERRAVAPHDNANVTVSFGGKTSNIVSCDKECTQPDDKYSKTEDFDLKSEKINGSGFSKIHCKNKSKLMVDLHEKEKNTLEPGTEPLRNGASSVKTVSMVLWDIINKVNMNNRKEHHIKKDTAVIDTEQPNLEKIEKAHKNGSLQDAKLRPSKTLKRKIAVSPSDLKTDGAHMKSGNSLPESTEHRKEIKNLIRQIESGNGPVNGCNGKLHYNQHQMSISRQKDCRINGIRDKHFENKNRVPASSTPPTNAVEKTSENSHAAGKRSMDSTSLDGKDSKGVHADQTLNSSDICALRKKSHKSAKLNGLLSHHNKASLSFPQADKNNENSEIKKVENMKSSSADEFLNELVDCNANHKDHNDNNFPQKLVPKLPLKQALENCSQCALNCGNRFLSLAKDAEPPDRAGSQCDEKISEGSNTLENSSSLQKSDDEENKYNQDKHVNSVLKKSKLPKILRTYPLRSSSYKESVKLGRDLVKQETAGDLSVSIFSRGKHRNCNLVPKKGAIDICDASFPVRNVTQTVLPVYNVSCDHLSKNVDACDSSKQGRDGMHQRQLRATPARLSMFYDQQNSVRRAEKELLSRSKKLKSNDKKCEKKNGYVNNCVKHNDIRCVNGNDFNLEESDEKLLNGCRLKKDDLSSKINAVAAGTNSSENTVKTVSNDGLTSSVDLKETSKIKNCTNMLSLVNGNADTLDTLGPFKCSQCKRYYRTKSSFEKHVVSCDFVVDSSSTEDEDEVQNNQNVGDKESVKETVTANTKQLDITRNYNQCTEAVSSECSTTEQNVLRKECHHNVCTESYSKFSDSCGTVKENLSVSENFGVDMKNSNQVTETASSCSAAERNEERMQFRQTASLESSAVGQNEKSVILHETGICTDDNSKFSDVQNPRVVTETYTHDGYSRSSNALDKICAASNSGGEVSYTDKEGASIVKDSCNDVSQQPAPAKKIKLMDSNSSGYVETHVQSSTASENCSSSSVVRAVCPSNSAAPQTVTSGKRSYFNAVSSSSLKKIVPRPQGQSVHQNIAKSSKSPSDVWHRTSAQPVLHTSQNMPDYSHPIQAESTRPQACISSVQGVMPDLLNPIGKNIVDYSNGFFNSAGTVHVPNGMLINPSVISQIQTVNGSYTPILQEDISLRQSHQYSYVGSVTITNMEAMSVSVNIPGQVVPNVDLLQPQLYPTQNLNYSQPVLMQNPLQIPPAAGAQLSSTLHVQELSIQNCVQNSGLRTIAFSQEAAISGLQAPVMYLDNMQLQQPVNSFATCAQLPGTVPHMPLGNHQQANCAYQPFITNSPEAQIHASGIGQYPYSSDVQNIPFQVCHPDPEMHPSMPQTPASQPTHAVIPNQANNATILSSFTPFEPSFEEQVNLFDISEETKSDSSSASMQIETQCVMSESRSPCMNVPAAENALVSVSNMPKNSHFADILCKAAEQMMSLAHMSKKPPESPASLSDSSSSELPVKKSRFEHTRKVAARKAHLMKNKLRLSHQASMRSSQAKMPKGTFQLSLGMINSQRIPFLPAVSPAHEDEQSSDSSTITTKSTVQPFPVTKTQPITAAVPQNVQDPYELSDESEEESPLLAAHLLKERNNADGTCNLPKDKPYIMFEISSEDGFYIKSPNADDAWKALYDKLQDARIASHMKQINISPEDIDGIQMMGLKNSTLRYIMEQLPGAENCTEYNFSFHPPCREEDEAPKNPSGCARCEPFSGRKGHDMFNFLASEHRKRPRYVPVGDNEEGIQKCSRRNAGVDLSIAMRFRNLKNIAREAVGVYRSNIHGRGLFCKRNIDAGELVIEYAGQVIRPELADKRELIYQSKGIGCYMFRIDDNDDVVDATMHGNAARFINHSCEPNCFSKVITVDGKKHIVIFALRRILKGEELTYDYKFPFEEEKIPCTCHSRRCRKYLN